MYPLSVYELFAKNLPDRADHPALVSGPASVSYAELGRRVDAAAHWLSQCGVGRGDRVGIYLPKSVEEVVATLAIAKVGAVYVNVNYRWTPHQLGHITRDCGLSVLFTDARRARQLQPEGHLDRLSHVLVRGPRSMDHPSMTAWDALPDGADAAPVRVIGDDLATLLYTSGSTGLPKGVMTTQHNVVQGAQIVARYLGNRPDDRVLGLLPLSFDYGQSQLTTMLLVGGTLVLQPVMMPAEIVATVVRDSVTGLAAVPPAWIQIVRHLQAAPTPLPSLRYLTNTGGKIPPAILDVMPEVFPEAQVFLMYGLTEAFRSSYLPPAQFDRKRGAIGQAIPGVELFVVDPEHGVQGPGGQGELLHRGALISRGYWGQPELTDDRIKVCAHLRSRIGEERVLYSGDLVRIDEDGVLWFVGRNDALIKCSGFRLSPTEVEDLLFHSGEIGDVVAFGVDDDELGQVVHVAVSPRQDGVAVDVDALSAYATRAMPPYMRPRRYVPWPGPMPRTASGKIDRPQVIATCGAP